MTRNEQRKAIRRNREIDGVIHVDTRIDVTRRRRAFVARPRLAHGRRRRRRWRLRHLLRRRAERLSESSGSKGAHHQREKRYEKSGSLWQSIASLNNER